MSDWKHQHRKLDLSLPVPNNIIHESPYRDRRVILTDDPRLVGQKNPDKWGFTTDRGFVVLDEFDEHVFPLGVHWFYTPYDAIAAIELLDSAMPDIKASTPATTFTYEHSVMRRYRAEFGAVYATLVKLQRIVDEARQFDDNPIDDIQQALHDLRQNIAQGRGIG